MARLDENDLQRLKQHLEALFDEMKMVKAFYNEIETMSDLVESLKTEIARVIHEADRFGFKCECKYEKSLEKNS